MANLWNLQSQTPLTPGPPAQPAASFLNAFEKSFESFLHNKSDESPSSSNTADPNSTAAISAIISSASTVEVQPFNPIDTEGQKTRRRQNKNGRKFNNQNQSHAKENLPSNNQSIVQNRPSAKSRSSKSILSPSLSLSVGNKLTPAASMVAGSGISPAEQRRRELKILEEEREKNEAVNNLLGLVNDNTTLNDDDSMFGTLDDEEDKGAVKEFMNEVSSPATNNNSDRSQTPGNTTNKKNKPEVDQRRFQCNSCPKSFKSGSHLKEHEITHSGIFPFNCDHCKKGFRRENALQSHKCLNDPSSNLNTSLSEPKPSKTFKCDECNKIYATKQGLQIHKCCKNESSSRIGSKKTQSNEKVDDDDEDFVENVHIEVPVILASSDIQFLDDGCAVITGDVINYELDDITVEDAGFDGWILETVNDEEICIREDSNVKSSDEGESLPCYLEIVASDTGIKIDEVRKLFEYLATQSNQKEKYLFPWQDQPAIKADQPNETLLTESKDLIHPGLKPPNYSTLDELPSLTKSRSVEAKADRRVSLTNFTYFNDKAAAIFEGSGDDTDDEDWSESVKCKQCKKEFSSKLQLKKHSKIHSNTGGFDKKFQRINRSNTSFNNSILLQSDVDDDITPSSSKSRKSENSMILFSTLN